MIFTLDPPEDNLIDPSTFFGSKKIKQTNVPKIVKNITEKEPIVIEDPIIEKEPIVIEEPIIEKEPIVIEEFTKIQEPITQRKESIVTASPVKKQKTEEKAKTPQKRKEPESIPISEQASPNEPKKSKGSAYAQFLAKKKANTGPRLPGSKEIPRGKEDCLVGLTFVFTGELTSISRDEAQDLVRRYGGRVTGAPSSKTSYLVVGEDAGQSKLDKAKKLGLKAINEDELFELIKSSLPEQESGVQDLKEDSQMDIDAKPAISIKPSVETAAVKPNVIKTDIKKPSVPKPTVKPVASSASNEAKSLWTEKYRPNNYTDVIGNKSNVEKLGKWLRDWDAHLHAGFKKDSRNDMADKRAVLISGPPGIGKTTSAHLVAKIEGWEAIEFNASDTRSKKSIENLVTELTTNHVMSEYFHASLTKLKKKQVIIMDEVDGMSAGDRGGNAQLIQLIKKTKVPIICICNDRMSPKVRSLANYCYDMRFRRPTADQIETRMKNICSSEGLDLKPNVIRVLSESTQADIRQIINILSTYKLSADTFSYDDSKAFAKLSEKNLSLGPWDVIRDLFNGATYKSTPFYEKTDFYFQDYQLIPLMVQENYPKVQPALVKEMHLTSIPAQDLETLNCLSRAADAISDSDLLDSAIKKSNNWSLLPAHGVMSTVTPAYFMHGYNTGRIDFPGWLGQFSKQGKMNRLLKELQIRMRLSISGDRQEVRQSYIPTLAILLTKPLAEQGKAGVESVINIMDDYYLSKEEWDMLLEMGMAHLSDKQLLAKVASDVKSHLTRTYNKGTHAIPFMSASALKDTKAIKATKTAPDLEDVIEDDVEENGESDEEAEENDLEKDRFIQQKKAKPTKASSSSRGRGRGGKKK